MSGRDFARAGKAARRKGANGELEIRDILRQYGFDTVHRNFQSGGQGGADLADGIPDCHLEVKRVENCSLAAWWKQASAGARPTDLVVIAHRGSMQPWMATGALTDLWELLRFFPFAPKVIGRGNPRSDFLAAHKARQGTSQPCVVHPVAGLAMATVSFESFVEWQADVWLGDREAA